jgi:enamine deaminase RidA (YjgF/YER057c/UK114 family)
MRSLRVLSSVALFAVLVASAAAEPRAAKPRNARFVNPTGLAKSPRPSHIAEVTSGKLVFISGQVAQDAGGNLVGAGDFGAQTRQVFENLKTALAGVGAKLGNVIKIDSYIVDISSNIEKYREVRQEYLRGMAEPPTSTTVGVSALVRDDYLLEVEAIAVLP